MHSPVVLIATARLQPGRDADFTAWKTAHDQQLARVPGFLGSDILPPTAPDGDEWTILLNFRTPEAATAWRASSERAALVAQGLPLFAAGNLGETLPASDDANTPESSVTEIIFSKVRPGMEDRYREWSVRMQAEQARYPGYRGMFLQPPEHDGGMWTTIIRYATAAQLEAWMRAPERAAMLRESSAFIEHEQLTRLATSFPGWVPVDPATGKGPPNWKTALLVLLGLFPIVMLEMRYLSPVLTSLGLHASLATFIGNAISVALTSFLTMPLFVRGFGWWLFLDEKSSRHATLRGNLLLVALFTAEVLLLQNLLPW